MEISKKGSIEREEIQRLLMEEDFLKAYDFQVQYALDFLQKHPEFQTMVKEIKIIDETKLKSPVE